MTKNIFLIKLKAYLEDRGLDAVTVQQHINYYSDYIAKEMLNGKSEDEIISSIGEPEVIGKSIFERNKSHAYVYDREKTVNRYEYANTHYSDSGSDKKGQRGYDENEMPLKDRLSLKIKMGLLMILAVIGAVIVLFLVVRFIIRFILIIAIVAFVFCIIRMILRGK